ncbi:hypothetical protein FG386_000440 [Cryptosporidium ryanae]|uniref:uncharacterized protein n=1 Tax=Cryptosporidium ryanae TaxID=515981 RepID=UPI00351A4FF2|nr:hypothetical protein FG386_000440 [Cryptosporidium ryanae]
MDWNPKFVPKRNRNTIIEEEKRNKDLNESILRDKRIKYEVCTLNRSELYSSLLNENNKHNEGQMVEISNDDKESEYMKWRTRELKRLKREYLDHLISEKNNN